MLKPRPHTGQLTLELADSDRRDGDDFDRMVEARAAELAQGQAIRWRFRLVVIETAMLTTLIVAAGVALEQPAALVLRGAAVIGVSCFLTGLMLIGLTGAASRFLSWIRRS
jgi:hypothetical protein